MHYDIKAQIKRASSFMLALNFYISNFIYNEPNWKSTIAVIMPSVITYLGRWGARVTY